MAKMEPIDDLLTLIPGDWDFHIVRSWDEDTGADEYGATLMRRAYPGDPESEHKGHYIGPEIRHEAPTLRAALTHVLRQAGLLTE